MTYYAMLWWSKHPCKSEPPTSKCIFWNYRKCRCTAWHYSRCYQGLGGGLTAHWNRSHHYFRIELYAWNVPNFVIFFTAIRFQSFCMFIKLRQQTNCLNVGTNCKSSRRIFRLEQLWKRRYCNLCRLPPQALSIDSIPQAQEKHRWEPRAWEIHLALTYLHRNHATRLDFWIR